MRPWSWMIQRTTAASSSVSAIVTANRYESSVPSLRCASRSDGPSVVLREQRDSFGDHALDLRALELRRILLVGERRQLRLEPLDERHEQVDVLGCGVADRHEPTPA